MPIECVPWESLVTLEGGALSVECGSKGSCCEVQSGRKSGRRH